MKESIFNDVTTLFSQWLVAYVRGLVSWERLLKGGEFLGNVPGIVEYHRRPTLINNQPSAEICTHIMQHGTGCSDIL